MDPARKRASYQDVLAAPEHMVAEVIFGTLYTLPRPRSRHARASTKLGAVLDGPFDSGVGGGPGGWLILDEPELHLGEDIVVPDLGGWRRERMPEMPDAPYFTLPPDWVCEVLSPGTAGIDRVEKMEIYARERVSHVWHVDPEQTSLEVFRLDGTDYRQTQRFRGGVRVRAEPFDAVEIDLTVLWSR